VTSPAQYQVFQRSGTTGTITISGDVGSGTHDIEARWNGGAWTTIDSAASGTYSGSLSGVSQGSGTLEVRRVGEPEGAIVVNHVGVGDVFLVMGQSNATGQAAKAQFVTPRASSDYASNFGNDYVWRKLNDRVDDATGQVDSVSSDSGSLGAGSVWPLVATGYIADHSGVPVAFVPCAKGSTSVTDWQPGVSHTDRTTLYGSCVYRAQQVGGARMALWWQGETDALAGMAQGTYAGHLNTIADALQADLGIKLMPAKLQAHSGSSSVNIAAINAAIAAGGTNIVTGPDLTTLYADDPFHLTSDGNIVAAASLWSAAITAAVP
jgi:hypothetical protein